MSNRMIHAATSAATNKIAESISAIQQLLNVERSFINDAHGILGRFSSVDESDRNCRRAIIDLTDGQIEWKHDLLLILTQHEKKVKELENGLGFLTHFTEEVKK